MPLFNNIDFDALFLNNSIIFSNFQRVPPGILGTIVKKNTKIYVLNQNVDSINNLNYIQLTVNSESSTIQSSKNLIIQLQKGDTLVTLNYVDARPLLIMYDQSAF